MTITLANRNQITLPKPIVDALRLHKGSLFDIRLNKNRIELIPLKTSELKLTDEDYRRLDKLVKEEKKKGVRKVTPEFIKNITKI